MIFSGEIDFTSKRKRSPPRSDFKVTSSGKSLRRTGTADCVDTAGRATVYLSSILQAFRRASAAAFVQQVELVALTSSAVQSGAMNWRRSIRSDRPVSAGLVLSQRDKTHPRSERGCVKDQPQHTVMGQSV